MRDELRGWQRALYWRKRAEAAEAEIKRLAATLGRVGADKVQAEAEAAEAVADLAIAEAEVERLRAELEQAEDISCRLTEANDELRVELAEARAEIERLSRPHRMTPEVRNAWKARAEAAEAEVERLKGELSRHIDLWFTARHEAHDLRRQVGRAKTARDWWAEHAHNEWHAFHGKDNPECPYTHDGPEPVTAEQFDRNLAAGTSVGLEIGPDGILVTKPANECLRCGNEITDDRPCTSAGFSAPCCKPRPAASEGGDHG